MPPLLPPPAPPPPVAGAALIQQHGPLPAGGRVSGSGSVPLERAQDGDTPVLTFRVGNNDRRGSSAAGSLVRPATVRLLLDTGASASMVTPALARRLALQLRAPAVGSGALAGGGQDCQGLRPALVTLPPLQLLPATAGGTATVSFTGVQALMLPVGGLPVGIDGVLGIPSLRQLPIRIDPREQRLHLGAAALTPSTTAPLRVPLEWRRGVPILRLQGPAAAVDALADTGAEGLFVSPRLAGELQPHGPAQSVRLVGVCGDQTVQRRAFSGLALPGPGSATRSVWEAIITPNPIFALLHVEAIVGQALLRDRQQLWRLDLPEPRLELW